MLACVAGSVLWMNNWLVQSFRALDSHRTQKLNWRAEKHYFPSNCRFAIFTNKIICSTLALYVANLGMDVIIIGVAQALFKKISIILALFGTKQALLFKHLMLFLRALSVRAYFEQPGPDWHLNQDLDWQLVGQLSRVSINTWICMSAKISQLLVKYWSSIHGDVDQDASQGCWWALDRVDAFSTHDTFNLVPLLLLPLNYHSLLKISVIRFLLRQIQTRKQLMNQLNYY